MTSGTRSKSKSSKSNKQSCAEGGCERHFCPVCDDEIQDSTSDCDGNEVVECEGVSSAWLHRRCAGLSKVAFAIVCKSD